MDVVPVTAFAISSAQGNLPTHIQVAGACLTATALILNNLYVRRRQGAAAKPVPAAATLPCPAR
jgi:hypothetical protein